MFRVDLVSVNRIHRFLSNAQIDVSTLVVPSGPIGLPDAAPGGTSGVWGATSVLPSGTSGSRGDVKGSGGTGTPVRVIAAIHARRPSGEAIHKGAASAAASVASASPAAFDEPEIDKAPKRKTLSAGAITQVWQSVYTTFEATCHMCEKNQMKLADRTSWEVSHVIPFSKGGSHELSNLRPLCRQCNRSMSSMTFEEYIRTWHGERFHQLKRVYRLV